MVSIASENVTVMLSVTDTELWLSAVVETKNTVVAVASSRRFSSASSSSFEDEVLQLPVPIILFLI